MASVNSNDAESPLRTAEEDIVGEQESKNDGKDGQLFRNDPSRPRFEITKIYGVGVWSYDVRNDWCAICHGTINDLCLTCQIGELNDDGMTNCPPLQGACNHTFHHHCISRWLQTQHVCPLDNMPWKNRDSMED
uniref:RING-type domain-containing protein n=1 Tax=Trichuris muris TaxID=70415 RepID=A0A5S6QT26_TRIMR